MVDAKYFFFLSSIRGKFLFKICFLLSISDKFLFKILFCLLSVSGTIFIESRKIICTVTRNVCPQNP